jgi:hypothetical protein
MLVNSPSPVGKVPTTLLFLRKSLSRQFRHQSTLRTAALHSETVPSRPMLASTKRQIDTGRVRQCTCDLPSADSDPATSRASGPTTPHQRTVVKVLGGLSSESVLCCDWYQSSFVNAVKFVHATGTEPSEVPIFRQWSCRAGGGMNQPPVPGRCWPSHGCLTAHQVGDVEVT